MTNTINNNIVRKLTPLEVARAKNQADTIANSSSTVIQQNQFVFFAAFDGTYNDKEDLPLSGTKQDTNVAELFSQVIETENVKKAYFAGPGAKGTLWLSEGVPTQVTAEAVRTANLAYEQFQEEATAWRQKNPNGSVTTMLASFSRGGAAAAIFSQMLYEKG